MASRKTSGTIYQLGRSGYWGEISFKRSWLKRFRYSFACGTTSGVIGFLVISFIFNFGPVIQEELNYLIKHNHYQPVQIFEADGALAVQEEADRWGVNPYFSVIAPKINGAANVVANVDIQNFQEFENQIQKGLVHQKGSFFPGQDENITLYSHSVDLPVHYSRFNTSFYLARKLEKDDEIIVFFTKKKYSYKVVDKQAIDSLGDLGGWSGERLVIVTCYPPGSNAKQFAIVAVPEN